MQNFDIVGALAFSTIGIVLVIVVISWLRARKAQDNHKDAAVAERQRAEDGTTRADEARMNEREGLLSDKAAHNDSGRAWSKERGASPPAAPITPPD